MTDREEKATIMALDYLFAVTDKQKMLLSKEELWKGYTSVFPDTNYLKFNFTGFCMVYDCYRETLEERCII